jgi:phosphate:Na+ symporter
MKQKIKDLIQLMSKLIDEMVGRVYEGLMKNDIYILDSVLDKERRLDAHEKEISGIITKLPRDLKDEDRKEYVLEGQIAANIERMGDELRALVERIELKIAEKLYFSDEGISQYAEVFEKMKTSVGLIVEYLGKGKAENLDLVLTNGDEIKALIEKYRKLHMERLTKGICNPRASSMFFDMLDYTGNVARHCTNIAKISKEK